METNLSVLTKDFDFQQSIFIFYENRVLQQKSAIFYKNLPFNFYKNFFEKILNFL